MKVLFHLKSGQKNELLLNLIFPDYPDSNGGEVENSAKEKETANAIPLSEGCAYTPVMVGDNVCHKNRTKQHLVNIYIKPQKVVNPL